MYDDFDLRNFFIVVCIIVLAAITFAGYMAFKPEIDAYIGEKQGKEIRLSETMQNESLEIQYDKAVDLGYRVYLDGVEVVASNVNSSFYEIAINNDTRKVFLTKKVQQ